MIKKRPEEGGRRGTRNLLSRGGRLADFNENQSRVCAAKPKPMVADRHNARAVRAHHSDGTTGTQTHFAQPMDVLGLTVDFENGARLTWCKVIQRHDLGGRSIGTGQTLH